MRPGRPPGALNKAGRKDACNVRMVLARDVVALADQHQTQAGLASRTAAIEDLVRVGARRGRGRALGAAAAVEAKLRDMAIPARGLPPAVRLYLIEEAAAVRASAIDK